MALGAAISRGGVPTDELVAAAIEAETRDRMAALIDELDDRSLAHLTETFNACSTPGSPLPMWRTAGGIYDQLRLGWIGRLYVWFSDRGLTGFDTNPELVRRRRRRDAKLELLIAAAAIRRYELAHDEPPPSLEALVPDYLPRVPRDPFGTGPLVYRPSGDGYLLYSVGDNGVDDGGQRPTDEDDDGDLLLGPS